MGIASPTPPKSTSSEECDLLRRVRPTDWINPRPKQRYDLIVIGGGPAGLVAAGEGARMGLQVALVERDKLGGNSLNAGAIPSKALVHAARLCAVVPQAGADNAVGSPSMPIDFAAVMARMRRVRSRLSEYRSAERLRSRGVDVFFGDARFVSAASLAIEGAALAFRKALVATGAHPAPANIPGLQEAGYRTSDDIFEISALPRRLAIIGGGPLGCELAQSFSRLGSHVTIVEKQPKFLPYEERDASQLVSFALARDGVDTRLNTTVLGVRISDGGKIIDTASADARYSFEVDEILLSAGRVPNIADLNLAAAGIDCDVTHGVSVDDFFRTTNSRVYAAGDVCLPYRFTNAAESSARIAIANAFGRRLQRRSSLTIPWCTYCDPEIAHVGVHVWDGGQSIAIKSYTVMMQDVDRAVTDGQDDGFIKIHVRPGTDEILGATIVATRASELINEIAVAMSTGVGLRALAKVPHTYPAQSDGIRRAAQAFVADEPDTGPARLWARLLGRRLASWLKRL